MDELTELATKYKADKWGKHHYTPEYYDLFVEGREWLEKVVEIGIGEGASLRMWHDFFPYAQIYGADIDPDRYVEEPGFPRIKIVECDQSKDSDLDGLIASVGSDINLFVDDGSHIPSHQLSTVLAVLPRLDYGVTYVIEDVADPTIVDGFGDLFDYEVVVVGKRYDDRLIILKHKHG